MNTDFEIVKASERYIAEHGWLKSYHLFSFADYYDPDNVSFGNLRVFNDDYIDGNSGFDLHPHDNMEILTIVLDGCITHGDSMGHQEKACAGSIQHMSAGTGIFHSEKNEDNTQVHLYQIWMLPTEYGIKPQYGTEITDLQANFLNLIYGKKITPNINTNINIYRGLFDKNKNWDYTIPSGRGLFIYVTSGAIQCNGVTLSAGDQARISLEGNYVFESEEKTDFIFIDVKF